MAPNNLTNELTEHAFLPPYARPLRVVDGLVFLGLLPLGAAPPLF